MRPHIILSLIVALPLLIYGTYELIHWNRTYPNLFIESINVGSLTKAEITQKLNKELAVRQNQTFTYEIPGSEVKGFRLNPNLVSYNIDTMVNDAFSHGRSGSLLDQITQRLTRPIIKSQIKLSYDFDELTTDTLLADMFRSYESQVLESEIRFENGEVFSTISKPGKLTNRDQLREQIKQYITLQSDTVTATVNIETKQPTRTQENSRQAIFAAQIAVSKPLTLREPHTQYEKTLNSLEIFDLIEFNYNPETKQTEAQIVNYKLATLLKDIPDAINTNPIEGQSQQVGDVLIVLEEARTGSKVDIQTLTETVNNMLFDPGRVELVEIPVIRVEPALTKATVNQYGIKDLLAQGSSSFRGSSAARLHNIRTAAAKLNGYLIAPAQTFSMYQAVGDIEKSTGYQDSVIIKNGRSIPGVGGGVCQVSTSLFRAALNAGLPIVERRPHSFRVSYYEYDGPPGFDAAVYFPEWDFKFHNNTVNHIVIQTTLDETNSKLVFSFWGVKDGRTVSLSAPNIQDRRPPPPEVRLFSSTVPQGIIRQTEFPAEGARVTYQRNITLNNQTSTEEFVSTYRPWQAVYLIGTKTD